MDVIRSLVALFSPPTVSGGGAAHAPPAPVPELSGTPTGPDLVLASGVRIRVQRVGNAFVTQAAIAQAIRGIQALPVQHQALLARTGIPIELLPVANLEQVRGTTAPVLGATGVRQDSSGRWVPNRIRVATAAPISALGGVNAIGEVIQHEIGHAISVIGTQDRSEEAAIRYAAKY